MLCVIRSATALSYETAHSRIKDVVSASGVKGTSQDGFQSVVSSWLQDIIDGRGDR